MIPIQDKLQSMLGLEQYVLMTFFCFLDLLIYKILLRKANKERKKSLSNLLKELFVNFVVFTLFWVAQYVVWNQGQLFGYELRAFYHYFGTAALITGAILFVRATKILVSEYLFLNSMNMGVPILLVNIVTLMISVFVAAWISTSVFGVRWAPLLATSAIVSVVLGLALQDTLGNLFAGVAMQFDKPFEIGDWVEVTTEKNTLVGEVHEITWRATTLYGFFDQVIVVPNRLMAQSEVANFSARRKPIYRGLSLYLDVNARGEDLKRMFEGVLKETPGVLQHLEHFVMLRDLTEKGAHWRLFYPIIHYSRQYFIVDEILTRVHRELGARNIEVSRIRVETQPGGAPSSTRAHSMDA